MASKRWLILSFMRVIIASEIEKSSGLLWWNISLFLLEGHLGKQEISRCFTRGMDANTSCDLAFDLLHFITPSVEANLAISCKRAGPWPKLALLAPKGLAEVALFPDQGENEGHDTRWSDRQLAMGSHGLALQDGLEDHDGRDAVDDDAEHDAESVVELSGLVRIHVSDYRVWSLGIKPYSPFRGSFSGSARSLSPTPQPTAGYSIGYSAWPSSHG
jgi:hypothetical protein